MVQGNPVTSALEGVAAKLQEALGDHDGPQMTMGSMPSETDTTTCSTDNGLSTKEKKEAADELASLEAALNALSATRGTTQIAQELREQIANKKKSLGSNKAHWGPSGWLQSMGLKVQGTTRPGFRSVQIGVSGAGESRRGGSPVNARVGCPGRGTGECAAWTGCGVTSRAGFGASQMHEQDLGGHEKVPQYPARSCERDGDVDEDPRGRCGPPGDVFFSASWGREGAGGEQEQAVEDGAKETTTATTGSRRGTPTRIGVDGIYGTNHRFTGYGRRNWVNAASRCEQRDRHVKRRWPVQVNECQAPSSNPGSKETTIQVMRHGAWRNEFTEGSGSYHFSVAEGMLGFNETPNEGPRRKARKNEFVARTASHHFRVATANVRTLCDKGKNTADTGSGALSGRAALLEIEMAKCGLDLVGIQEGRTQTDQVIEGVEYTMVVAGADTRGNYGTQL